MSEASAAQVPGIRNPLTSTPEKIARNYNADTDIKSGQTVINGTLSRDPLNTSNTDKLFSGLVMGRITATKKYAPTILGLLTVAYDASATPGQMTVSAATAVEISRRIGGSGTFKLTGPDVASGTVRTNTITYSAVNVTTGVITVTDISEDSTPNASIAETTAGVAVVSLVSEVEEIQTLTVSGTPTGGTFQIGYNGNWTTELAFDISAANVQVALRLLTGLSAVTCSGGALPGTAVVTTMVGVDSPELMELDLSNLTGGTPAATMVATTPYVVAVSAVSAVTEIQTITISAADGTFRVGYLGEQTDELAHDVSTAALQTALQALTGLGSVTVTGTAGTSYVITLTGLTGPQSLLDLEISGLAAVLGDYIAGSQVKPTDGSEDAKGFLLSDFGTKVTDEGGSSVDARMKLLIGGQIYTANIKNVPSDTSLLAALKADLNANANFVFDDEL